MAKKTTPAAPNKLPPRDARAAEVMDWANKKMRGHAQLKKASEYVLPFMTKRMHTGLLSLDVELKGGFPCGGLSQLVGPYNSGKTYLAWQAIRQQQYFKGEDLSVLLAMTEMRADRTQARLAGVAISLGDEDIDNLDRARAAAGIAKFTKEEKQELRRETGHIYEVHAESAELLFDVILRGIHDNAYHIIIIDSFGSIMSAAENESKSLEEKHYSGAAKPITEFLRKMGALLTMDDSLGKVRDVCLIGINQVRDAIGDPNLDYRSTGGRALEHYKFVDVFLQTGRQIGYEENLYTSDGTKKRWVQTGKEVNWKIVKGKAGIHEGGRGSYVFDFRTGAGDFYLDTLVAGVRHGVIELNGSYINLPNPENRSNSLLVKQGKDNFIAALVQDSNRCAQEGSNDSLMNLIRAEVFKKNGIYLEYDWE
jgi:RecA/RadA recombinase